jgi:HJR/Mrr/RecB family endonuclease
MFAQKIYFSLFLTMQHITGISRQELQISSLEDKIGAENPVRFIDVFVEHISFGSIGFTT